MNKIMRVMLAGWRYVGQYVADISGVGQVTILVLQHKDDTSETPRQYHYHFPSEG